MWGIGKLAQATECNIETIRYYEKLGLLPTPPRTEGGHRLYDDAHRSRLLFIRRGRALGFTLDQIRQLIDLSTAPEHVCEDALAMAQEHLTLVETKLAELGQVRDSLRQVVAQCQSGCGCGTAPPCSIIDALAGDGLAEPSAP